MHDSTFEKFLEKCVQEAKGDNLLAVLRDYHRLRTESTAGDLPSVISAQMRAVDTFIAHATDYLKRNPAIVKELPLVGSSSKAEITSRKLVYKLVELPHVIRIEIADQLGLRKNSDEDISNYDLLARAVQKNKLDWLCQLVDEETVNCKL